MTQQETLATNDTATDATGETGNQAPATKTYTQEEFDKHMAGLKASISKKYEKTFAELGDLEELKALKSQAESKRQEDALNKGQFEIVMKELAAKKDQEIARRDQMISEFKIEMPLIQAASQFKSVNPEQVKALLRNQVRLSDGEVEVVDEKGQVRYSDKGTPLSPTDLVKEFLHKNPHFVSANPTTTNSKNSINSDPSSKTLDISTLDMSKAEHRALYKEYKVANGIR
jgi:hypothetical protein